MQANNNLWQLLPLGKIASNSSNSFVDGPFGSNLKSDEYTTEGVRLIQLQNIGDGEWIDDNKIFTSEKKYQELKRHSAFPGDIAIAKMADPIARACIIPPVSDRFLVVADCIKLTPDLKKYHPKFIVYAINNHSVRLQAELKSTGTTRNRINLSLLKTVNVEIPPLPEQRHITEILDTIDEAIQKTEVLISKLKAMKQGLLHDLLTRGLDKNGKLRDPKAHLEQFKDSPLGRIPREWEILRVKDFVSVKGGKRLPKRHLYSESPTKYRYLRVLDFFEREIDYNSLQYLKEETFEALERYEIQDRDVFISIAGSIGYTGAFNSQIKDRVILTENAARLVTDDKFQPEYLAFQLNSGIVQDQILKEIGTGGGVPKLALHRIENLKVICPSINEQMRIVDILDSHDARIRTEEQYRDKLKLQKKGIMHDLLTGKVQVKV